MTTTDTNRNAESDEICPHCGAALDLQEALAQDRSLLTKPLKTSRAASKPPPPN